MRLQSILALKRRVRMLSAAGWRPLQRSGDSDSVKNIKYLLFIGDVSNGDGGVW